MRFRILTSVVLFALSGCAAGAPSTAVPVLPRSPASESKTVASTSCAYANAAPKDTFRSDDPGKLNSNKPKLVEFFAYW